MLALSVQIGNTRQQSAPSAIITSVSDRVYAVFRSLAPFYDGTVSVERSSESLERPEFLFDLRRSGTGSITDTVVRDEQWRGVLVQRRPN